MLDKSHKSSIFPLVLKTSLAALVGLAVISTSTFATPTSPSSHLSQPQALPQPATLEVTDVWVRQPPSTQKTTALYGTIKNLSQTVVTLEDVCIAAASRCELHQTVIDSKGVASMNHHPSIDLKPGQALEMNPGGFHIMVMGLKVSLKKGDTLKGTVTLHGPQKIPFEATVQ